MVKVGLGTERWTPRPRAIPRAMTDLPAPRSPVSSMKAGAVSLDASLAARVDLAVLALAGLGVLGAAGALGVLTLAVFMAADEVALAMLTVSPVSGWTKILAAPGVGSAVHCQTPSIKAKVWFSAALG